MPWHGWTPRVGWAMQLAHPARLHPSRQSLNTNRQLRLTRSRPARIARFCQFALPRRYQNSDTERGALRMSLTRFGVPLGTILNPIASARAFVLRFGLI